MLLQNVYVQMWNNCRKYYCIKFANIIYITNNMNIPLIF